jgi:hypothetical protein
MTGDMSPKTATPHVEAVFVRSRPTVIVVKSWIQVGGDTRVRD